MQGQPKKQTKAFAHKPKPSDEGGVLDAEALVEALYQTLLLRGVDPDANKDKCKRLVSGGTSIADMIAEILRSEEFRIKAPEFLARLSIHPAGASERFSNNQSQYNEIDVLLAHLLSKSFRHKVVVDVGARGRERSNSWDLMKYFGWRGVLVEANPNLATQIHNDFAGLRYKLVQCAVSDYAGQATFVIGVNDDVSSLNPEAAKAWGATKGEIKVEVRRLPDLLDAEKVPFGFGLLSLDIEGEDVKVLNDLIENSRYRPGYIIIEASYDFQTKSLEHIPVSARVKEQYEIVGQTRANLILAKK